MDKECIESVVDTAKNHTVKFFLAIMVIAIAIHTVEFYHYEGMLQNMDIIIQNKDAELQTWKTNYELLEKQIIRDNINEGAIPINISNQNVQNSPSELILNSSSIEKDFLISELFDKINDQNRALGYAENKIVNLTEERDDLAKMIPAYNRGFVGTEISIYDGGSYEAGGGNFIMAVTDIYNMMGTHSVTFRLNGVAYTKYLGEQATFDYLGENYVLNIISTGNPAKFTVHKPETIS